MRDCEAIAAADGWWACYYWHSKFHFARVVLFATRRDYRDNERNEIVGIDCNRLNERLSRFCEDDRYFKGYVHESDFSKIGKILKTDVKNKFLETELPKSE